jgi:RNA polymerase sigma-70 factor, ECF subfamily
MSNDSPSRREFKELLADDNLLAAALTTLPKSEAEVLWLYHARRLSFQDIGDRMGVSRKSIRSIWAQGFKSLEETLDGPRR